ncbi:Rpn family recombination-promoting nuclease/putative transposase [Senegalia sp. (in: firmicutes)]|uniref:Rpn family recombination-promoting nuclease/putative transposase n=1 Tax=Senegalia sp. (in: firmicutes) TaxID=1924098 RepID=UPI003F94D84A
MDALNQPHDKYFRATFGEVSFTTDFLNNYLPKDLLDIMDMDTLQPQKGSYLDKELKEQFTDLLFRVNINNKQGYVYFLFEHKSYKDRMVIFQVLKYMVEIWEGKIKEDKEKRKEAGLPDTGEIEIPIILPLVVYHDKGKWSIKRTLGEMIHDYDDLPDSLKKHIPNFEYLLFDLSQWQKKDIRLQAENMIAIKALSKSRHASKEEAIEILIEAIELINRTEEKDIVTYYVSECIKYMLSIRDDISEKEMEKIADKISIEGGELVMSVAERLRKEGEERGIEIGEERGAKKERIKLAKDMIENSEPLEKIIQYTKLDIKEIEIIKLQMDN